MKPSISAVYRINQTANPPHGIDWFKAAVIANEMDCLKHGASHTLLSAAGIKVCWRCSIATNPADLSADELRVLTAKLTTATTV